MTELRLLPELTRFQPDVVAQDHLDRPNPGGAQLVRRVIRQCPVPPKGTSKA